MSFVFVGIYWNNHHHLFHAVQKVSGASLWANLHLLFWLSLIPFVTGWMGENGFPQVAVAVYGVVLLFSGLAYFVLVQTLLRHHGKDSKLASAVRDDFKGKISLVLYILGIGTCFFHWAIGYALYAVVACIWFIPDRRIEKVLSEG